MDDTRDPEYAVRLATLESKGWKKLFDVQAPYRRNLRKLNLGRTLDVGCGLGRNLINLENGVGVDHNFEAVKIARSRGLTAYSTSEWGNSGAAIPGSFDSILLAHVLEHVSLQDSDEIIASYLPYLRTEGKLVLICPQEKGFPTDPTHIFVYRRPAHRESASEPSSRPFLHKSASPSSPADANPDEQAQSPF